MTKYLGIFSAEGVIAEKSIGNVNLWFVHEGIEQFQFLDDYFRVQEKYTDYIAKSLIKKDSAGSLCTGR